jgi:hypothetical protein
MRTSFQKLNEKSRIEKSEQISIGANFKSKEISAGTISNRNKFKIK